MLSMIIWVVALAAAISGVSVAAAFESQLGHLATTAFVTFAIVAAAVTDHRQAAERNVSAFALAALSSRYMGLMWAWAGVSAYVVYGFLLEWPNWLPAVMSMFLACAAHLFFGFMLDREALAKVGDVRALRLLGFTIKLFFGLAATLFGLLLAYRNSEVLGAANGEIWVATNLATCTAAGLLSLTGYLILHETSGATVDSPEAPSV